MGFEKKGLRSFVFVGNFSLRYFDFSFSGPFVFILGECVCELFGFERKRKNLKSFLFG
jgi:hypothetical protein